MAKSVPITQNAPYTTTTIYNINKSDIVDNSCATKQQNQAIFQKNKKINKNFDLPFLLTI